MIARKIKFSNQQKIRPEVFKPVLFVIGILLSILSVSMIIPMFADLYFYSEDWKVFFVCAVITAFFGGSLILSNNSEKFQITTRQAFLLTALSWFVLALFGALPFRLSALQMNFTDAFFESMSGITTTGSTVIVGLNDAPPGILIWRAMLQWLGGIGIIVMALSVLPFLKVGGMQLFRMESSENEKALPRAAKLASSIGLIYLGLTLICMVCYMLTGLSTFDALAHAMTTIATGGFSTFDTSFAHYDRAWTEVVAIVFMTLGALPFVLYLKGIQGDYKSLYRDTQVQWFFAIVILSIMVTVSYLTAQQDIQFLEALRRATFSIISVITGTGYSNGDYTQWGGFAVGIFFFLMVVGGCAGSTTCGIKIFRFQVLYSVSSVQMKKLLHPNGVFIPQYNRRPIPNDVPLSVMSFFFLYALCFSLIAIALSYVGMDFLDAMSGAVTSISNVGPGLGSIGPAGTFKDVPNAAKWILSAGMLLGRLELFTVLVMLSPHFWRR